MSDDINYHEDSEIEHLDINTRLAIQRTILSNTRTFSAWIRTGLSLVLAGFGIVKFMDNNENYQVFVSTLGITFVIVGISVFIYAYLSYRQGYKRLDHDKHRLSVPLKALFVLTVALVASASLVIILLILFK